MATPYNVIIIGTGAGGGTLARHLAPSGKRILLLERGDWLPRELQNSSKQGRSFVYAPTSNSSTQSTFR
jgi:choline dehydrogenase-like flavoprotein